MGYGHSAVSSCPSFSISLVTDSTIVSRYTTNSFFFSSLTLPSLRFSPSSIFHLSLSFVVAPILWWHPAQRDKLWCSSRGECTGRSWREKKEARMEWTSSFSWMDQSNLRPHSPTLSEMKPRKSIPRRNQWWSRKYSALRRVFSFLNFNWKISLALTWLLQSQEMSSNRDVPCECCIDYEWLYSPAKDLTSSAIPPSLGIHFLWIDVIFMFIRSCNSTRWCRSRPPSLFSSSLADHVIHWRWYYRAQTFFFYQLIGFTYLVAPYFFGILIILLPLAPFASQQSNRLPFLPLLSLPPVLSRIFSINRYVFVRKFPHPVP